MGELRIERVKLIEFYFERQYSIVLTQHTWDTLIKETPPPPSIVAILALLPRFQQKGSVHYLLWTGRPWSACSQVNIEKVQQSIDEEQRTTTRCCSQEVGITCSSLRHIQRGL